MAHGYRAPAMDTSAKTLHDLEWPALVGHLADRCTSLQGRDRALSLLPAPTLEDSRVRMQRTAQALALARQGDHLPLDRLPDVREVLARMAREADVTSLELHGVLDVLRCASTLRRWSHARRATQPALTEALASDPALDKLLGLLDHAMDPDGTLADRASTDLGGLRREVHAMRARVIARLDEFIARYAEVLQDRYYTLRDGRYVLPVRSDAHVRVPGIVHGSSASGATLFIEPRPVMALGNQLKVLQADVEREEARILRELTDRVRERLDAVHEAHEACTTADVLAATVRLGGDLGAIALTPSPECVLDLKAARHPLLALTDVPVVANDLVLRAGSVLVVSGPNAGGKTVALKTLGLVAMMARAGLPLPVAEGSRVGWFDPVECDVGDDQSLARSLSTFSAHITNLAAVIERSRAVRGALVLLDELAGGTDPEEGAALAASVLEHLAAHGAAVAVTTHYELLKTLAVRDPRFYNASVGFDMAAMAPTFSVTLGIPGASSALAVARRYGVPAEVIDRARALLPEHADSREDVLRRLQDEERATRIARHAAEDETARLADLRSALETERQALRTKEDARVSREGAELLTALRRAREELRGAEARLRHKKLSDDDVHAASRMIQTVAEEISIAGPLGRALEPRGASAAVRRAARDADVHPGARLYVPRLGMAVDVLERVARDQVRVAAGAIKLFVGLDELQVEVPETPLAPTLAMGAEAPVRARAAGIPYDAAGDPVRPLRTGSNTCDIRGLRVDDAAGMVDAFLDRIYQDGATSGFVLHGHGTGALKAAVREQLKGSPYITRSRAADPEDGGDAFTVFWLRN